MKRSGKRVRGAQRLQWPTEANQVGNRSAHADLQTQAAMHISFSCTHLNWSMANCSRPGLTLPTASTASAMPPAHGRRDASSQRTSFIKRHLLCLHSAPSHLVHNVHELSAAWLTSQIAAEEAPVAGELAQHLQCGRAGQQD